MSDTEFEVRIAWQRHIGTDAVADHWFDAVVSRYREPHRHYHDLRHLRWVVRHVEQLADDDHVGDLDAVIAAACFHDVIYDATAHDNETASARLAASALDQLGWNADRVRHTVSMIEGTTHHEHADADHDHRLLYAADLAVLAASPAGYADYVRAVRREYHHVTDADWVTGRTAVLAGFLDRSAIYAPSLRLDDWELRARGNLTSELDQLRTAHS